MKKILISLSIIGVVAAIGIGATIAYFNDTETSTGNILVAGTMDLKVDHTWETYNDVDCNTCDLTLISDQTNMVVKKNDVAISPYPAVFVSWIHPAWTAQNDPQLATSGARWIWSTDPTLQEDTTNDVTYTFEKTFEWYGPIISSDLWFAIGSDNSIKVWLNGTQIATNSMEFGYQQEHMLHIPAADVTSHIVQGENILTFEVKNWALPNGNPQTNPAGLIYKFYISGNCQDNYFKQHCRLWSLKDLQEGDYFWNFSDVKPGDHGINIISLHAYENDAYACLFDHYIQDYENTCIDPENAVSDPTCDTGSDQGELSGLLKAFVWVDSTQNNTYDNGETILYGPNAPFTNINTMLPIPLTESNTKYIGIAWCFGTQTVDVSGIHCSGSGNQDIAQTDSFLSNFTVYAEQQRNNPNFSCGAIPFDKSSPKLFQ